MIHNNTSGIISENRIHTHNNYSKVYVKNSGQYGLDNQNNSFTFSIDHNTKNPTTNSSIHYSKQYILDLTSQAWKEDKFQIETGKFADGYPKTDIYNLCNQKLSVVFKFAKDQYSRKEDDQDIYKPDSIISKNITNNLCSCPDIIIQNGYIDDVSSSGIAIALDIAQNLECCCNIQYSFDGLTWQQLSLDNIDCNSSQCLSAKIKNGEIYQIFADDSFVVQINPYNNAKCCCSARYSLDDTDEWFDVSPELVECDGSTYDPPVYIPPIYDTDCKTVFGNQHNMLNKLDTGINIRTGDQLTITTEGQININWPLHPGYYGPDGIVSAGIDESTGFTTMALLGQIGSGPIFKVGSSYSNTATDTGKLYLFFNDPIILDNLGSFVACISKNLSLLSIRDIIP